ncbi:MAG TPA: proton-conducting transporter membrane subunit [Syntrophomonadaceae bacterium]|nr:proton-conducting transporter membrane subunit [Syntrophomonadaceae bacterium]
MFEVANNSILPWLVIVIPAAAALVEYLLGLFGNKKAGIAACLGSAIAFGVAIKIAATVAAGLKLIAWGGQLYVDGLGALMAVVVTTVGLAASVFSYRYIRHDVHAGKTESKRLPLYFTLVSLFICSMVWGVLTNNIIMLYVVIEATTLASALLVTFYWHKEALEAGYKYLLLCSVGITFALFGCVLLFAVAAQQVGGQQAMMITHLAGIAGKFPHGLALLTVTFLTVGFGTKAGLIPFHTWLPDAHSQSPSPVSALLSGVSIKVAAYALARTLTIFYPQLGGVKLLIIILGAVTMLLGIIFAFAQDDLKRMLAFSSVSQMGYIIMGFGVGSYLGFFGSFYHILNHAILKGLLFLCTGALLYTNGTTFISGLRYKEGKNKLTTICFFVAAFAVGGLPPFSGFWSKFTIFLALAQKGLWWAAAIAVFTSLLTLACLVRAGYMVFMEKEESHHDHHEEEDDEEVPGAPIPWSMSAMMAVLALASLAMGLYPRLIYGLINAAVSSIVKVAMGG